MKYITNAVVQAGLHLRREGSYTFTAEESTIEGLCPCLYSMTNPSGGPLVEVVKTIDYGKCTHKSTNGTSHKPIQAPMATTPIDRSTIYRYTIKWPSETSDDTDDTPPLPTQPLCVMARAELHSQYTTVPLLAGESPQMALVTSELVATGKFTVERHEHNNPPRFRTSPEQLGYDTSDEEIKELFYLHGDEKLNGTLRSTPFNSQVDRAEMGMALIKDIERELGVEADGEVRGSNPMKSLCPPRSASLGHRGYSHDGIDEQACPAPASMHHAGFAPFERRCEA